MKGEPLSESPALLLTVPRFPLIIFPLRIDQGAGVRWVGRIGRHGTEELFRRWSLNRNPKEYRELMEKLRVFETKGTLSANAPTVGKSFLAHSWEERMAG